MRSSRTGSETRETILTTAERLFAEKGFAGCSIADICGEVGIAKPSLFHHFKNKQQLYAVLLSGISDELRPLIDNCRANIDARAGLIGLAYDLDRWNHDHPDAHKLVMRDMLDFNEQTTASRKWLLTYFVEGIHETFLRLPEDSRFSGMPFSNFLAFFLGTISYYHVANSTLSALLPENRNSMSEDYKSPASIIENLL